MHRTRADDRGLEEGRILVVRGEDDLVVGSRLGDEAALEPAVEPVEGGRQAGFEAIDLAVLSDDWIHGEVPIARGTAASGSGSLGDHVGRSSSRWPTSPWSNAPQTPESAVDIAHQYIGPGPGGHFFGTPHTLERFEHAFYQPMLSDWRNFETWQDSGAETAAVRANRIWKQLLAEFEPPPLAIDRAEAIEDFVARRKREIGAVRSP